MVDVNTQFGGFLTDLGAAKNANANALGVPWKLTHMLIGDANGADPVPAPGQTALVNQVYRAQLNQLYVSPTDDNVLIAELVLPPNVGGWWIRELALEDEDGVFSAVANCAPSYKPVLAQGSGRNQVVRMHVITSGTANIQLKIDPSVVLATRAYVDGLTIRAAKVDAEDGADNSKIMTALRVWQAITKRFSNKPQAEEGTDNSTALTPLGASQFLAARTAFGGDSSSGKLMAVGAFGLGGSALSLVNPDLNENRPTGFYYCNSPLNHPPGAGNGWLLNYRLGNGEYAAQTYIAFSKVPRVFERTRTEAAFGDWQESLHTGNVSAFAKNLLAAADAAAVRSMLGITVADGGLGYAQTWQDVTANRAWNTTYTNTTGKPIQVSVIARDVNDGNLSVSLYVGSLKLANYYHGAYAQATVSAIVPPGATYLVERLDNNDVILGWMELR
ncbi:phage tail-collar fiber domain-containing protein [Stutzerimonas nitrititolerans]|uniref:phage tail-collar fiber domain-containing protein n=1 Tax=Stutzerimonas nitrititolerans TaxID=2482751 RepID=UPI001FD5FC40|nr:phage tail protein [Stutzerimonas nitrititolerans]